MEVEAAKQSGSTGFTLEIMTEASMGVGWGGRADHWGPMADHWGPMRKRKPHRTENQFRKAGCARGSERPKAGEGLREEERYF